MRWISLRVVMLVVLCGVASGCDGCERKPSVPVTRSPLSAF